MAATLLQSNHNNGVGSQTSFTVAFLNPVTPGSLLIGYVGSSAATRTFTASDTVNGSWNIDVPSNGGQGSAAICSFPNTAAGTPTVTFTISGAATIVLDGIIEEWSGIQTTTPFDQSAANQLTTVTSGTAGTTGTLSQANELCVAMINLTASSGATFAVQSPFTASPAAPWPALPNATISAGYYLPGASTSPVSCTFNWTSSRGTRGATATYKTVQTGQLAPFYSRKYVLFNT